MYNNISGVSFNGITKIYAVSDTHQETRKVSAFLSRILESSNCRKNTLFLHCGDFYEGIYPKELERDCYIKMKEANPDIEMVMTLGNHDFGHNQKGFDFLVETVKKFTSKGIKVISSNILEYSGKIIDNVKPYAIVEIGGDKNFITGFCVNSLKKQGQKQVKAINNKKAIDNLKKAIEREKPDNIIILNHDFKKSSKDIIDYCKSKGINVDLIIGGHDHRPVKPDIKKHIYYPSTFAESMYSIDLVNNRGTKELKNIKEIKNDDLTLNPVFKDSIEEYEEQKELLKPVAKSVFNLKKDYNNPSPYGSFLADSMKEAANADIGFFSTGFLKHDIPYKQNGSVTYYDFKRSMPTETPIQIVNLSVSELKEVFSHALKKRGHTKGNTRFLQCSNNVKIAGLDNKEKRCFEIKQIYIDDTPLLDESGNPISEDKIFKCAIDSFIAKGGQQFKTLENKEKQMLKINNKDSNLAEVLEESLKNAQNSEHKCHDYPYYQIIKL